MALRLLRDRFRGLVLPMPPMPPMPQLMRAARAERATVGARADVIAYELRSASSEASALEAVLDSPDLPELVMAGGQVLRGPDRSIQATQGARP